MFATILIGLALLTAILCLSATMRSSQITRMEERRTGKLL